MSLKSLKKTASTLWKKFLALIDARPLLAFFGLLGLLLILITIGNFLRTPAPVAEKKSTEVPLVDTYTFGQSPTMAMTASIEKSGVISIYAQAPGIVQQINTKEGNKIGKAGTIVSLSSTYQGGNIASISRQIAQKNYEFTTETYDLQKDLIAKQRDLANKGETQAQELRDISKKSIDETKSLISLNEEIISKLDAQISSLESSNVGGSNDSAILGAKQGKAGAQAGLNQLRSALRAVEYQTDDTKIPAGLPTASRDLTLKQLDLQERSLTLSKDISGLSYKLARVSESMMFPATPCSGIVERIYVKVGQSVNPGTLIATIKADQNENTAVVLVTADVARQVSRTDESTFRLNGKKIGILPRYVSTEATQGNLYSVLYSIPAIYSKDLTNNGALTIDVALGASKIVTDELYVPLDAIYQTGDASYLTVIRTDGEQKKAKTISVELADVSGSYVKVKSGLKSSDVVLTSRGIQDGTIVRTE